ncbi:MAG: response regulator [Patescibacteria group bacterium]|nr:response regulator [Patescibacteria group bacterium]
MKNSLLSKVLIIDDDDTFFNVLKPRLDKRGVFLIRARDGEEGIRRARIEEPELIITDIVMPRLNGFDLIKALKQSSITRDRKYIILSDYGEKRFVENYEFLNSLGICKYLIKSNYTPIEIVNEVIETLKS